MHRFRARPEEPVHSCPKFRDCAVFSIKTGERAVTLIFVLSIPHTHTLVLAGQIAAWVHSGGYSILSTCGFPQQQQEKYTSNSQVKESHCNSPCARGVPRNCSGAASATDIQSQSVDLLPLLAQCHSTYSMGSNVSQKKPDKQEG